MSAERKHPTVERRVPVNRVSRSLRRAICGSPLFFGERVVEVYRRFRQTLTSREALRELCDLSHRPFATRPSDRPEHPTREIWSVFAPDGGEPRELEFVVDRAMKDAGRSDKATCVAIRFPR